MLRDTQTKKINVMPSSLIIKDEKDLANKLLEGAKATERGEVYDIEEVFNKLEKILDS